jgi:hypothetical protein
VLGERAHELEPVGELGEVLGTEQDVDLGAGARVRLDGSILQPCDRRLRLGLRVLLRLPGCVQLLLDRVELDPGLVVLLDHDLEAMVQIRQLGFGGVDVGLGGGGSGGGGEGTDDHGENEDDGDGESRVALHDPGHFPPRLGGQRQRLRLPRAGTEPYGRRG